MRAAVACLFLTACNQLLDVKLTQLVDAPPATPEIALVQVRVNEASVGTYSVDFLSPITGGNAIVAAVYTEATDDATVSDGLGNTFTKLVGPVPYVPYAAMNAQLYLFAALNVAGGPDTVTIHSTSGTHVLVYLHEFANLISV